MVTTSPTQQTHSSSKKPKRTPSSSRFANFGRPAALIAPGERTGKFRTGANTLIADAEGNSRISAEDYAIAFVDELEQGRFIRQIATVAY